MATQDEENKQRKTISVTSPESGKTYQVDRDIEEGSIAHGIERLRTGYDQVYLDQARKRARSAR